MCGIFGYYNLSSEHNKLSNSILHEMASTINHRGPDGNGYFHDENIGFALGNVRLAILDLEHGQQPIYSDDKKIIVVQNGEIFNFIELRNELESKGIKFKTNCDTEVILRIYENDGIDGLKKLNGMFAIAIYDYNNETFYLIKDRVGEKPLYYYKDSSRIIFASEIKSILKAIPKPSINFLALEEYFSFNYVPHPNTLFQNIYNLAPGHYLAISKGVISQHCWWDLSQVNSVVRSEDEYIKEFNELLEDATRIRLYSDVPFGAFLSGGVDSSTVVGLMSKLMDKPVKTYSIGFEDPRFDESIYAQEASQRFSTDHTLEIVNPDMLELWPTVIYHCDQPHGDASFMPTYKVAQLASEHVKMVLTGDGADELFAGYDKYLNYFNQNNEKELTSEEFIQSYSSNISLFKESELKQLFAPHVFDKTPKNALSTRVKDLIASVPHMDRINQALYIDTMLLLSGNNLVKPDRMGMASSIENRAPFLDYRIIEFAFGLPGNVKLHNNETKYIYKKAVEPLIGKNLTYRKKQMFTVPVGEWFKSHLQDLCKDLLLSPRTKSRQLFDYDYIQSLYTEHCNNIKDNTRQLRALMSFEYWCRTFLD
ncbi:asparagine synthase (glutamine-hydrolyzing) [Providencia rettgeri]|nr:asparagine synthase (glutamine-hydrolyzing) [Providencia rettgeri]